MHMDGNRIATERCAGGRKPAALDGLHAPASRRTAAARHTDLFRQPRQQPRTATTDCLHRAPAAKLSHVPLRKDNFAAMDDARRFVHAARAGVSADGKPFAVKNAADAAERRIDFIGDVQAAKRLFQLPRLGNQPVKVGNQRGHHTDRPGQCGHNRVIAE